MNITLVFNQEERTLRVLKTHKDNQKKIDIITTSYIPLKKWDRLIQALDHEFGNNKNVIGQDLVDYSYKTFRYENGAGIWVHCEPYEFLIDYEDPNDIDKIKTLVISVGYKVNRIEHGRKRMAIKVPF